MPRSSTLKSGGRGHHGPASVQDYLAAIYDLAGSGKPVIGARLAKHMSISAPAVTEAIHRMARGGYVKIGRGKELALSTKGPPDRRGHGAPPPSARALADGHARPQLDRRPRGGHRLEHALSPRVGGPPGRAPRHAEHVPARQPDPPDGRAAPRRAVSARPGEGGRDRRGRAHHRGSGGGQACSSISGGTTCVPGGSSRSPRWRRGLGPSPRRATAAPSRSGCRQPPRSGSICLAPRDEGSLLDLRRDRLHLRLLHRRHGRVVLPRDHGRRRRGGHGASADRRRRARGAGEGRDRQEGGGERNHGRRARRSPWPTRGGRSTSACAGAGR